MSINSFTIKNAAVRLARRAVRDPRANYPAMVSTSGASSDTMEFIKTTKSRHIAEIGIYLGDTSVALAEYLNGEGELHLFDYYDRLDPVVKKIKQAGYSNIITYPNSYKLLDSYNWPLAKLIETSKGPIYDYIFIDGAHTFAVDALTFFLSDKLLKVGGYVDFDDCFWTLRFSPSMNPKSFPLTGKSFTDEQIDAQQVKMILDVVVRRDPRYREVVRDRIFQKIG